MTQTHQRRKRWRINLIWLLYRIILISELNDSVSIIISEENPIVSNKPSQKRLKPYTESLQHSFGTNECPYNIPHIHFALVIRIKHKVNSPLKFSMFHFTSEGFTTHPKTKEIIQKQLVPELPLIKTIYIHYVSYGGNDLQNICNLI